MLSGLSHIHISGPACTFAFESGVLAVDYSLVIISRAIFSQIQPNMITLDPNEILRISHSKRSSGDGASNDVSIHSIAP